MKSFGIVALFASVAFAQLNDIPPCALNCFLGPLSSDGCTNLLDFACHCQKPQLIPAVQPCVEKACTPAEVATVLSVVSKTCADAGFPISVPNGGGSSSTPPPASSSAAPASSSQAPPASSSAAPATTTPPPSYSSSTPTPPSNHTVTTASPSGQYTGAASRPTQIGALLAAIGLAAVAL
jgi:hypothetical protein